MGFRLIAEDPFRKVCYYPIQKDIVEAEIVEPELEWDYVKPFTVVTGDYCPHIISQREQQKKVASGFTDQLPIDDVSLEQAKEKDPNVIPGFYVFGKYVPSELLSEKQFKKYLKKAIRDEGKKTFGATAPQKYEKRKGNV